MLYEKNIIDKYKLLTIFYEIPYFLGSLSVHKRSTNQPVELASKRMKITFFKKHIFSIFFFTHLKR